MKKKIVCSILLVLIAFAAGWNIYQSKAKTTLNELAMGTIEALAVETPVISCPPPGDEDCVRILVGKEVHIFKKPFTPAVD